MGGLLEAKCSPVCLYVLSPFVGPGPIEAIEEFVVFLLGNEPGPAAS